MFNDSCAPVPSNSIPATLDSADGGLFLVSRETAPYEGVRERSSLTWLMERFFHRFEPPARAVPCFCRDAPTTARISLFELVQRFAVPIHRDLIS
jgi:hypothetical protein